MPPIFPRDLLLGTVAVQESHLGQKGQLETLESTMLPVLQVEYSPAYVTISIHPFRGSTLRFLCGSSTLRHLCFFLGLTHAAVTPMDLAKCRLQVDPTMYKGILDAWGKIGRAEGAHGAFKYGGYEFFKKYYADLLGEDVFSCWKTPVYLAASASAELIANIALCPFEAVKVRMQTTILPFATRMFSAISHITAKEGIAGRTTTKGYKLPLLLLVDTWLVFFI
ncbi:hypothetical protein MGYG_04633 [Nannizzia gypsea CBS 118893]|uniref:Uncharacterized protein n=1 Tax=Arthroderma gypseum (strain ATCC MYA-4604 / CBS 118893) TaxID=535722 RepID=E4UU40_ARTGP|nr:hypothetical protein MGYG_04633 [Nannizzia gypsea CBS 118893]EFR01630.1 hypothetical protein MGYG_04633 [Nannizzia gypsea CBS 118893]